MSSALSMSRLSMIAAVCAGLIAAGPLAGAPLGTGFTYQGQLQENGSPCNGTYDFQFSLYDSATGGAVIGAAQTLSGVSVTGGQLTVVLNAAGQFGPTAFDGNRRWLQIQVCPSGAGSFETLSPRQEVTATPNALFSTAPWATGSAGISYAGGNVGIGGDPGARRLAVFSSTADTVTGTLTLEVTQPFATNWRMLYFRKRDAGNTAFLDWIVEEDAGDTPGISFKRASRPDGGAAQFAYPLYLSWSGNVGIGTIAPQAALDLNGSLLMGNGGPNVLQAKNSSGAVETFLWPRWSDDAMYLNFGAGGFYIRNRDAANVMYIAPSGNVGIGITNPAEKLDVAGTAQVTGFKLPTGASAGKVLTSDASGVGTWQTPGGGLTLPYTGTVSTTGMAFSVSNISATGTTIGIYGVVTGTGSNAAGVSGYATNPGGIYTYGARFYSAGAGGAGVTGRGTATGSAANFGGQFQADGGNGTGVQGIASATGAATNYGGQFTANGSTGVGLYAKGGTLGYAADFDGRIHAEGGPTWTDSHWGDALELENASAIAWRPNSEGYSFGIGHTNDGLRFFRTTSGPGNTSQPPLYDMWIKEDGTTSVRVLEITGADLAEKFPTADQAAPGTVMEIDPDGQGQLRVARGAYNCRVAGVISGANGLSAGAVLGNLPGHEDNAPLALSGRVWTFCDAASGAIQPGDLLTTSDTPGHAMKVTDHAKAQGAILGKAMTGLESGKGFVLVLVTLQ